VDNNGDKRPRMSVKQGRRASAFGTKNAPRIFISNGRQDRDVGAAAGGSDDSDGGYRRDREPVGFADTLKFAWTNFR
jgi:hypothetical protein